MEEKKELVKEVFYTRGEDKKIDKLLKAYRNKYNYYKKLNEKLKEASIESNQALTVLRQ